MRTRIPLVSVLLLVAPLACTATVNTLPPAVSPTAQVEYADLDVPAGLEIRSVDFSAAAFANASGAPGGAVSSTIGGRAFVKVFAVRKGTGEQFLLLYEDIAHRRRPIQIIRFNPSDIRLGPDSTR